MTFGEKVRTARMKLNMTMDQLADAAGISKRALINYETKGILPKSKDTFYKLAEALEMDAEVLMDENAEFVMKAALLHGSRGARQASKIVSEIKGLYAGGDLSEEDMDAMMKLIQDAYWVAKEKNKRHTNKRYLANEEE